jgi:hypothetical protein
MSSKNLFCAAGALVVIAVAGVFLISKTRPGLDGTKPAPPDAKTEPERAFAGASDRLRGTIVLPTLDSPMPENQSAIWCASVQLAWNRLKNDLAKEPVKLRNGQAVADRLNQAPQSEADVSTSEFLAMAGKSDDGIGEKITAALAEKFPGNTMPPIEQFPQGIVAFGYLKADIHYRYQFTNSPEWLSFMEGGGATVSVRAFGLPELRKNDPILGRCREQVRILFRDGNSFAVNLSHNSKPNRILLAKMPRKSTLAGTLTELDAKIAASQPVGLSETASLLVPNLNWRIDHDFLELEGTDKEFLNAELLRHYLAKVFQFVDFKMDRFGSSVESGAYMASAILDGGERGEDPNPDHFYFDRPFLIVMTKRYAKHPFFVMWVDNAELLCNR